MRQRRNLPSSGGTPGIAVPCPLGWLLGWVFLVVPIVVLPAAESPMLWRWSNPKPHGGNVVDMTIIPAFGAAVQVAELGQIFSSSDFNFWTPRASGTSNNLRAVSFIGSRLIITGEAGTVLYGDALDDIRPGTLTSGPTEDWLEAVTASPSLAVAVGDSGAVYTSTNGIHWTRRNSGTTEWLRGVALGDGGFVAVGESGKIISSVNGTSWISRNSGTSTHLNQIAYRDHRYTVVAENGECRYSTNGAVTWYPEVTGAARDLFDSVSSPASHLVVGDDEVWSQFTGQAWVDEIAKPGGPPSWIYLSAVRTSGLFLTAGRTGLIQEAQPNAGGDALLWTPGDQSPRSWLWDVTCPVSLYVAVGDRATVMTSGDGVDWKLELVPPAVTNSVFLGVCGTTNMLVSVGSEGSLIISPNIVSNYTVTNIVGTNIIVTNVSSSTFGVIWHALSPPTTNDLQGIGASEDLFVVAGGNGVIFTSVDATNWTERVSPTAKFLSGVTAWPGGWVATGDDGAIVTSSDGLSWNLVPPVNGSWLYRSHYADGIIVAAGQNGTILTSTDAVKWDRRTSGSTAWLNDVTFVDGTWFVIGNSGTVLTSTNAINWTPQVSLTRKNLYATTTDGQQLVCAGTEGVILRSQIIPDQTPISILSYDHLSAETEQGTVQQNIFLFGGKADQRFTLDYRSALDTNLWIEGAELEFFDGSGTLFYLETVTSTNPAPKEFYRATLQFP